MNILFEACSVLQCLLLGDKLRKASVVYLHLPVAYDMDHWLNQQKGRDFEEKIRRINPQVAIRVIPRESCQRYAWQCNKESLDVIDQMTCLLEHSDAYQMMLSIFKDRRITKHYQRQLAWGYAPNKLLFLKIGQEMLKAGEKLLVIPSETDWRGLGLSCGFRYEDVVPARIRWYQKVKEDSK